MPQVSANGLMLEYETLGNPAHPPILLIMGLGAPLVRWPQALCQGLVDGGYYVIRFDNRDVGLSEKLTALGPVPIKRIALRALLGLPVQPPYTLDAMAEDVVGLLDALGLRRAHVLGVSMGGMIGQILAARHPDRVRSFVSMMSTSGSRALPGPSLGLRLLLIKPLPRSDREARMQRVLTVLRRIASPVHPRDEAELRAQVEREFARSDYVPGYLRQLAAIIASPSRLPLLPRIQARTLILHGRADPLVPVDAAYDLRSRIPGAQLEVVPDMAHDMPAPLLPRIVARIVSHLRVSDAVDAQ